MPSVPTPRQRILRATADSVRDHGFRGASITDIVRRAQISRRTYYDCFPDRESCLLELFELVQSAFRAQMQAAVDPALPWRERVTASFDRYLETITLEPRLAVAFIQEMSALGEQGSTRSWEDLNLIAGLLLDLVDGIREDNPEVLEMPRATALLISGGLRENIGHALAQGQSRDELAQLTNAAGELIIATIEPRA